MDFKEQKKIKAQIIKALKAGNIYNKDTDDFQIDNLVMNLVLIDSARKDIAERGSMVNISSNEDRPFYQINFSVSIFHNAIKSINTILKQLGLEKIKPTGTEGKTNALEALNKFINENTSTTNSTSTDK